MKPHIRKRPEKQYEHRINNLITAPQIRLIGDDVEPGIYSLQEAKQMAEDRELDLVEISPNAEPPVCRILDYNKFLYEKKKREKELKAKQQTQEMKEIRFTPNTDEHDLEFKTKHALKFLEEGNKVRAYVQFKGRMIMFKERGELLLLKFAEALKEVGAPEELPKLEGKRMSINLIPKTKKK